MDRLLTIKDIMKFEQCSRTNIWRRVKEGRLPAPIKIGPGSVRFSETEYLAHRATLPRVDYAPNDEDDIE